MQYASIERIEGNIAVLVFDDCSIQTIASASLPANAAAGDMLQLMDNGDFVLAPEETARRKARMLSLQDDIFSQ